MYSAARAVYALAHIHTYELAWAGITFWQLQLCKCTEDAELLQSARASHDLTGESELEATVTVSPLPVFINSLFAFAIL